MSDGSEQDDDRPTPVVGPIVDLAQEAFAHLGDVVPRLIDRSRQQASFALAVIERLRCGSDGASNGASTDGSRGAHHDPATRSSGAASDARPGPSKPPVLKAVPDPTPDAAPVETPPGPAPAASTLAIPDYDSLAASQVLPRLDGLSDDELESVRAYEAAHRNRRTILGRLAQLLG